MVGDVLSEPRVDITGSCLAARNVDLGNRRVSSTAR
jgi:hypothetical protein